MRPLLCPQLKKGEALPAMPAWVVDLDAMTWTPLDTTGQLPTARGGHTVRGRARARVCVCVGGGCAPVCLVTHGCEAWKSGSAAIGRCLRPLPCPLKHALPPRAPSFAPNRARSHTQPHAQACPLPDDKIVVFGGEDSHRRPLADVYVLDLQVRHSCVCVCECVCV
jgi:hypothetical protein